MAGQELTTTTTSTSLAAVYTPSTFSEAEALAIKISESGMVPQQFRNAPGNVLTAMMLGAELGLRPMQALQNVAVINGRPSVYGDAAKAIVMASPLCVDIIETFDTSDPQNPVAICVAKRKDKSDVTGRFAWGDAVNAGLAGKSGPWTSYPMRMLQMRARSFALRDQFPDVLNGMILYEEAQDIETDGAGTKDFGDAPVVGGDVTVNGFDTSSIAVETASVEEVSTHAVETNNQGLLGGDPVTETEVQTSGNGDINTEIDEMGSGDVAEPNIGRGGIDLNTLDKNGVAWDARIHSSNQKMTTKGYWNRARNLPDTKFNAILTEILGGMSGNDSAVSAASQEQTASAEPAPQTEPTQEMGQSDQVSGGMDFSPEETQKPVNTTAVTREDKISSFCAHCGTEEIANRILASKNIIGQGTGCNTIDDLPDGAVDMIYEGIKTITPDVLAQFK